MLEILAQSLRIATRLEDRVWVRDAPSPDRPRRFWQRGRWRQINPKDL